jgi:hypothetical protein
MSTLLFSFIRIINQLGLEADVCEDRTLVVGAMCKTDGPPSGAPPELEFGDPLEISNGF